MVSESYLVYGSNLCQGPSFQEIFLKILPLPKNSDVSSVTCRGILNPTHLFHWIFGYFAILPDVFLKQVHTVSIFTIRSWISIWSYNLIFHICLNDCHKIPTLSFLVNVLKKWSPFNSKFVGKEWLLKTVNFLSSLLRKSFFAAPRFCLCKLENTLSGSTSWSMGQKIESVFYTYSSECLKTTCDSHISA